MEKNDKMRYTAPEVEIITVIPETGVLQGSGSLTDPGYTDWN